MFGSNRLKRFKDIVPIAIGFLIVFVFCVAFYYSGKLTGYIGGHKDYNSTKYAAHAEKEIEQRCLHRESTAMAECIVKVIEATQEHQRAERDVVAQENMSLWALWMAVISGATVFVTAIGVWWVKETLTATTKAANAAVEGTFQAQRASDAAMASSAIAAKKFQMGFKPWLEIRAIGPFLGDSKQIQMFNEGEQVRAVNCCCNITIQNISEMPATVVDFEVFLEGGEEWSYVKETPQDFRRPIGEIFEVLNKGEVIGINNQIGIVSDELSAAVQSNVAVLRLTENQLSSFMMNPPPINGAVTYLDPIGITRKITFAFQARPCWGHEFQRYGGKARNTEYEIDS